MCPVGVWRRHDDLTVACQLDIPRLIARVGERHATYFGAVGGHHGDLGSGLDVTIDPVQGDPIGCEPGTAAVGPGAHWLVRC